MKRLNAAVIVALSWVLVACGGSQEQVVASKSGTASAVSSPQANQDLVHGEAEGLSTPGYGIPAEGVDRAAMLQKLSRHFNGRFANEPEGLMGQRQADAGVKVLKSFAKSDGAGPAAVHRFFNTLTGVHFYTISEAEKARVAQALPHFNYEGSAFFSLTAADAPLSPVYRFYSIYTGTHFYTISSDERDYVLTNYAQYFSFEGVAWFATVYSGPGWVPMHRFYNNDTGTHFYTTSEEERLRVIATLSFMEYEGIGYYVRADGAALPVSPVSSSNARGGCLSPSSTSESLSCDGASELPLRSHVEGNRQLDVTASRFVALPGRSTTDCTVDTVTGLVWESKDAYPGTRGANRRFTHLDRTDSPQVVETRPVWIAATSQFEILSIPRVPTQAEVDSSDNSQAYVDHVNGLFLCGFTDWRIPTASELLNVLEFGWESFPMPNAGIGPYLSSDVTTFQFDGKNTAGEAQRYTVDSVVAVDSRAAVSSNANSDGDFVTVKPRSGSFTVGVAAANLHLVLVRGAAVPSQSRYSVTTFPYPRDAANNGVIDNWSKLQWRRCLEGEIWNGSTCIGQPISLNLYDALANAALAPGWRMPGIKELDSIGVRRQDASVAQWDTTAFPSTALSSNPKGVWSMSRHWRPIYDQAQGKQGLPGYQASVQGTTLGTPAASISLMSRYKTGYSRLLRVHP